jgi:hypothetical protein
MALVNFLKFSSDKGAIIADEEFWNVYFRKRMHGDNLHALLDPEIVESWGVQVVYGAVGYPSIHQEVVTETQEIIRTRFQDNQSSALTRVKDVARIAFDALQSAIRRRIDQKMSFYYGFTTNDLNNGSFQTDGEEIPIEMDVIKTSARKLASRETKDPLLKSVLDSKAAVFGYDTDGITGYYLAGEHSIMGYVHEGFEAIGSGKYASGLVFGQDFKTKTLKMRQSGYEPAEGFLELIDSAFLASEHFKEVGGNLNMVMLDRTASSIDQTYREIFDDQARLATEIVKTWRAALIDRATAVKLIHELIVKNKSFRVVEKSLFEKASDPVALQFILRRYKIGESGDIAKRCESSSIGKGKSRSKGGAQ